MVLLWKSIVVVAMIEVAQPDANEFNHLLRVVSMGGKHIYVSFTGPTSLGKEGETLRIRLGDVECEEGFGVDEHPKFGPSGYQAWICNADQAETLK